MEKRTRCPCTFLWRVLEVTIISVLDHRFLYYRSALLSQTIDFFITEVRSASGPIQSGRRADPKAIFGRSKKAGGPIQRRTAGRSKGAGGPIQRPWRADPKAQAGRSKVAGSSGSCIASHLSHHMDEQACAKTQKKTTWIQDDPMLLAWAQTGSHAAHISSN